MERWIPMFDIFLNSPCPETEASLWLRKNFNNPSSDKTTNPPISTSSFISLLVNPTQSKLARVVLSERNGLDFWVKKAAQTLMDLVSVSEYEWISPLNLDSEEEEDEKDAGDELCSLPEWLEEAFASGKNDQMFPWLPMAVGESNTPLSLSGCLVREEYDDTSAVDVEEENAHKTMRGLEAIEDEPLNAELEKTAKSFKSQIVSANSKSKALQLAKDIQKLCAENSRNSLTILNVIEPWSSDDDTAALLMYAFLDLINRGDESNWPCHVLCSTALPKFLSLDGPYSRELLNATSDFCKAHQRAAEYGLLLPLLLRKKA